MDVDYNSRGLDKCRFCGNTYNVGERIPRIIVNCGHTLCTDCLNSLLNRRNNIRCPLCRKFLRNLESVEKLPLNINILYEIVESDPLLGTVDFSDGSNFEDEQLCEEHPERIKHFYCSNHKTLFCRECIKLHHTAQECFVVDLYEI